MIVSLVIGLLFGVAVFLLVVALFGGQDIDSDYGAAFEVTVE